MEFVRDAVFAAIGTGLKRGAGWKEVIAVVSRRPRWQRPREGPWNAEELGACFC